MSENGQSEPMPASKPDLRSALGPPCEHCGAVMVLKTHTPHPTMAWHEWRTYRCPACAREQILGAPVLR